ncbi:MAG: minor capsid protein [Desulfosporosinus sp.]|nr:minor capsid protein [Desulfosporosinus sp.]
MAKYTPPPDPIDAAVLARMQKDLNGYLDTYRNIMDKRQVKYAEEIRPLWLRINRNITAELKAVYNELQDANGVPITKRPIPEAKYRNMQRKIKHLATLQQRLAKMLKVKEQDVKLGRNLSYEYSRAYYYNAYALEQAAQVTVRVPELTEAHVMGLLANPWLSSGGTYGNRIRANTVYLAGKMEKSIVEAVGNGWDWNRTARRIQEVAGEGYFNSVRLARTELNRAAGQGANSLYMENADLLDGKRWNATLDSRTAPKDARNDGKIYPLEYDTPESPGLPGERIPNHPNCRCSWAPVLSSLGVSTGERIARGAGDRPDKFGERIYTKARTYEEYAKERGLPSLSERLANDNPKSYLRRGESVKDYSISLVGVSAGAIAVAVSAAASKVKNALVNIPLTDIDYESIAEVERTLTGVDITDRRKMANTLMRNANLSIPVSIKQTNHNGYCQFTIDSATNELNAIEYVLRKDDARPIQYHIKTALHEFFHAKASGLRVNMTNQGQKIGAKDWTDIEETATEAAAHYMTRKLGITDEIAASYAEKLIRNLPRLKQLDEFKDCVKLEDFGAKFLKYRFAETTKTVDWERLSTELVGVSVNSLADYAPQYESYVMSHKAEMLELLYDSVSENGKLSDKASYMRILEHSFDSGWKVYSDVDGPGFTQSLIIAMQRLGVK